MDSQSTHFRVSPQILKPLGLEQLQDPALALLELIKNSWDADAHTVRVDLTSKTTGTLRVTDDGTGMSRHVFDTQWLVFGESRKRTTPVTDGLHRPIIGEKGLGRIASYSLGSRLTIETATESTPAFRADVDWAAVMAAATLDAAPVTVRSATRGPGTTVEIHDLRRGWGEKDLDYLARHVELLAVPAAGDNFLVTLALDGHARVVRTDANVLLDEQAEAEILVVIDAEGAPVVERANVQHQSYERVAFRSLPSRHRDPALAGTRIRLRFFLRSVTGRPDEDIVGAEHIRHLLEQYEGVRIFRDGLNVPPYGIGGSDWAKLEKQRTATGGPTMVPGNSQLIGEVQVSRTLHSHLAITAGRSGFTDQEAVQRLAEYVRWAARAIGVIRRAHATGVTEGKVVGRLAPESARQGDAAQYFARQLMRAGRSREVQSSRVLKPLIATGTEFLEQYQAERRTARIYAQLASIGASAASFAHELRKDFDIVAEVVSELAEKHSGLPSSLRQPMALLQEAWRTIHGFVGLFRIVPVKSRRDVQQIDEARIRGALTKVIDGIPHTGVSVSHGIKVTGSIRVAPAELDSIVLNLYTNAIKAVRDSRNRTRGRVSVSVSRHGTDLVVLVKDNGVGVSPAVEKVMWRPLEGSFTEGTGMGLPITRFLAGLYDGSVSYEKSTDLPFRTAFKAVLRGVASDKKR